MNARVMVTRALERLDDDATCNEDGNDGKAFVAAVVAQWYVGQRGQG